MNTPVGAGAPGAGAGRKTLAIVVVVIVVVALIAFAVTVMLLTRGGGSPSDKVRDYLGDVERKEIGKAFNTTVWSLNQSLFGDWVDLLEFGHVNYTIKINSLTEVPRSEYTSEQRHEVNNSIKAIEAMFKVTVENYSFVRANITVSSTDDGNTDTENSTTDVLLVKVNGDWLIVLMLDDLENKLGYHEPSTPVVVLARTPVTGGVKISIVSISQPNTPWDNLGIILQDGTSSYAAWHPDSADLGGGLTNTANYSALALGALNVCCRVTDLAGNGGINSGDYIVLFTYGGATPFFSTTTYTVSLVYTPTADQMGTIWFTG